MKEAVQVWDYAQMITERLFSGGILLNTNGDKFNSMVIGWAHLGRLWGLPTAVVYVRENRYTRAQLDKTKEFSLSIPEETIDPEIARVCGSLSGNNIDKVKEAHLTLEDPEVIQTPGIKECPLTLECKVIYRQRQELELIPEDIRTPYYPQDVDGTHPMANRDPHTMYVGQIVSSYFIR